MATTLLERLLYMQGDKCFFCEQRLDRADASVEHIVAKANGGGNGEDNCVAVCKSLNSLFGSKSLKEKLRIVLNRRGDFRCPAGTRAAKPPAPAKPKTAPAPDRLVQVIANLRKQESARPRTVKTLTSAIAAMFRKQPLSSAEVDALVKALQHGGYIALAGTKVAYHLSAS